MQLCKKSTNIIAALLSLINITKTHFYTENYLYAIKELLRLRQGQKNIDYDFLIEETLNPVPGQHDFTTSLILELVNIHICKSSSLEKKIYLLANI